jgi:hypothetical protein
VFKVVLWPIRTPKFGWFEGSSFLSGSHYFFRDPGTCMSINATMKSTVNRLAGLSSFR